MQIADSFEGGRRLACYNVDVSVIQIWIKNAYDALQ